MEGVTIQVFQFFRNIESYFRRSTVVISKKLTAKKWFLIC